MIYSTDWKAMAVLGVYCMASMIPVTIRIISASIAIAPNAHQ